MTLLKRIRANWKPEDAIHQYSTARADRHRIVVEAFGESKALTQWELDSRMSVSPETLINRLSEGWHAEDALSAPAVGEAARIRNPQKLYHGKPITQWMKDPRCQVSRATLLRNFQLNLPVEEALSFRMQGKPEDSVLVADTVKKALELMAGGGEIWHYKEEKRNRISLIVGDSRYDLPAELFVSLKESGHVNECFSSDSLAMYQVSLPYAN